jgi:hypothetical protein
MWGTSLLAEDIWASQEGLCSTKYHNKHRLLSLLSDAACCWSDRSYIFATEINMSLQRINSNIVNSNSAAWKRHFCITRILMKKFFEEAPCRVKLNIYVYLLFLIAVATLQLDHSRLRTRNPRWRRLGIPASKNLRCLLELAWVKPWYVCVPIITMSQQWLPVITLRPSHTPWSKTRIKTK